MVNHRDYVWKCDYGERQPVIDVLNELLDSQNPDQLGMCSLFVNNNVYQLEFFVVLGYEVPEENQILLMHDKLTSVGARLMVDITFDKMMNLVFVKRFNTVQVNSSENLESCVNMVFQFADRNYISSNIPMGPIGMELPIFLSHSSMDKPFVETLIPYLSRHGLPVWYDNINIAYGESIVQGLMDGIEDSGAVIFFITQSFIASKWCKEEMESFLSRVAEGDKILPVSVVFPDVSHEELPRFIKNKKYIEFDKEIEPSMIANKLIPVFKAFFDLK